MTLPNSLFSSALFEQPVFGLTEHPFSHLVPLFGEAVVYQNKVYVESANASQYSLQSSRSQVRKNLVPLGAVADLIKIPDATVKPHTPSSLVRQAVFYYKNPQKSELDLLRFVDKKYRQELFNSFFSKPFYLTRDMICEPGSLFASPIAIFRSPSATIPFASPDLFNGKLSANLTDMMSTSFNSHTPLILGATKSGYPDVSITYTPEKRYTAVIVDTAVPSHKIISDGRSFTFKGTVLRTTFFVSPDHVMLNNYPKIVTPGYRHPFVHANGDVCYNGNERFTDIGMRAQNWQSLDDKLIGYRMGRVLYEGLHNLTKGYDERCTPVNRPECLVESAES